MKEALKLALEFLEDNEHYVAENERHAYVVLYNEVIKKCKAALAQPAQRTWVDLEPEDRLCAKYMLDAPEGIEAVIDYITAKLKEKNT